MDVSLRWLPSPLSLIAESVGPPMGSLRISKQKNVHICTLQDDRCAVLRLPKGWNNPNDLKTLL